MTTPDEAPRFRASREFIRLAEGALQRGDYEDARKYAKASNAALRPPTGGTVGLNQPLTSAPLNPYDAMTEKNHQAVQKAIDDMDRQREYAKHLVQIVHSRDHMGSFEWIFAGIARTFDTVWAWTKWAVLSRAVNVGASAGYVGLALVADQPVFGAAAFFHGLSAWLSHHRRVHTITTARRRRRSPRSWILQKLIDRRSAARHTRHLNGIARMVELREGEQDRQTARTAAAVDRRNRGRADQYMWEVEALTADGGKVSMPTKAVSSFEYNWIGTFGGERDRAAYRNQQRVDTEAKKGCAVCVCSKFDTAHQWADHAKGR